ncbi:MAG: hypothetical protein WKF41_05020 [Gaiellaceae bacterium]
MGNEVLLVAHGVRVCCRPSGRIEEVERHRELVRLAADPEGQVRGALAAVERHLTEDGKVAVVVPTHPLLEQWVAALERQMPNARIGVLRAGEAS